MTCQQDKCKNVFVTWVWIVGILIGLAIPITVYAFNSGAKIEQHEQNINQIIKRLDKIDNIDKKIDKILKAVE